MPPRWVELAGAKSTSVADRRWAIELLWERLGAADNWPGGMPRGRRRLSGRLRGGGQSSPAFATRVLGCHGPSTASAWSDRVRVASDSRRPRQDTSRSAGRRSCRRIRHARSLLPMVTVAGATADRGVGIGRILAARPERSGSPSAAGRVPRGIRSRAAAPAVSSAVGRGRTRNSAAWRITSARHASGAAPRADAGALQRLQRPRTKALCPSAIIRGKGGDRRSNRVGDP
jgi:hypothetical protein